MPEKSFRDVIMGGNTSETLHTPKRQLSEERTGIRIMHRRCWKQVFVMKLLQDTRS